MVFNYDEGNMRISSCYLRGEIVMSRNLEEFIRNNYKDALKHRYIQPFYQPVIRTSSGKLCSFESLARWIDPEIGMIYPDEFIPVLENDRVINQIDESILMQVCSRLRRALDSGETPVPVSVNLSRLDFTLCDIFSKADSIVSKYQIPHEFIYFEITESVMADQQEQLKEIIERFHSEGYQIWMDDFGSAYSSLNALKEFYFDEIKLDMVFVRPFTIRSRRIATSIVEMAKRISIHTLIEGIETEEQYDYFRDIGCEKVQGYYFGKPMAYEDAMDNMRKKEVDIERPQDRQYYDKIGMIDFLSAVPLMTMEERDSIVTARQLNSIPLALAEFSAHTFSVLFYNSAFKETADSTGLFSVVFTQEMINRPQPYSRISSNVINLMDSVRTGGSGRMLFTNNERYYEMNCRCVAATNEKYCVLIKVTDLSKDQQSEKTGYLDEFARRVYALFDRITLVNFTEDTILPLYTETRSDLVSGRKGIRRLLEEYAEKYLYPDDREKYVSLFDPENARARFADTSCSNISNMFRTSRRHGKYIWKEYTLLKVDDEKYLMLVRNIHEGVISHSHSHHTGAHNDETYSPAHLWDSLVRSDILCMFWKDKDRRFLGASRPFLDYYGFASEDDIIGKNDEDLGWHVHPDRYMNDEMKVINEGVTTHNVPGLCMNNGENKEILASKTPLYDHDGDIRGLIGFFVDRDLLTANDRRGEDTTRKDLVTGLLNPRGIYEEASAFRDEYDLRGVDFARYHIEISDFKTLNSQYGFDFGDKVLDTFGRMLLGEFGLTCAIGRYEGYKFVVIHQLKDHDEAFEIFSRIKAVGEKIRDIDGTPLTLYLSVGYALYSEFEDIEKQARQSEMRLHTDFDDSISTEDRVSHASEVFSMFDDLPVSYSVYHVTIDEQSGKIDAVLFYVNKMLTKYLGVPAEKLLGRSSRELYPSIGEEWYRVLASAAFDGEQQDGCFINPADGQKFKFTVQQIIYPGYCAVTYVEIPE